MSTTNEELAHLERTGIELSECDPDFVDGKYVCVCERVSKGWQVTFRCGGCSAGRSFYMKHDLCDAYTQATHVLELVKMVEGEIGGWAAREMLREEIDSLKAERDQALAALAEANERIAGLEQKPRPHVVAQLFPAKKVVGRGGICKNCGTAVYWSSDKPKWVHTNGRAPCHPGWKMRAEVDND
jgi:hypothetical protein